MYSLFDFLQSQRRHFFAVLCIVFFSVHSFSQEQGSSVELAAFPNPTNGLFTIKSKIPLSQLEAILVTDINGRVIHGFTMETSTHALELDFRKQTSGEYFVHLIFDESSERIRIQKVD